MKRLMYEEILNQLGFLKKKIIGEECKIAAERDKCYSSFPTILN